MRLGVFGGTFNPIHFGHLRAAEEARESVGLDKVIFVPAASPPFKSGAHDLAEAAHRLRMTAMAVAENRLFEASDLECGRAEKSYTVETARALTRKYPGAEIYFILGVDAFLEVPLWREPDELVGLMNFIIVGRPTVRFADLSASPYIGVSPAELDALDRGENKALTTEMKGGKSAVLLGSPLLEISSTAIRKRVREGRSVKYLLPERLESFIITNRLYRGKR